MPYEYDPRKSRVIDKIYENLREKLEFQAAGHLGRLGPFNPWNRFLSITQHREGGGLSAHLAFRIYDGHTSIFSREKSGKRFMITVIPETVGEDLREVKYQIAAESRYYYIKSRDGLQIKNKQIKKVEKMVSAGEVLEFFLLRLREHQVAADTARNIFATGAGIGVLSTAFLLSGGSKHEPRKHVKPETTQQRTKPAPLPAPVSPAPAPLPSEQEKIEKPSEPDTERGPLGPSPQ